MIKLRQEGKEQERENKKIEQEQNFTIGPSREGMSTFFRARPEKAIKGNKRAAMTLSTPFQDLFHKKPSQSQRRKIVRIAEMVPHGCFPERLYLFCLTSPRA